MMCAMKMLNSGYPRESRKDGMVRRLQYRGWGVDFDRRLTTGLHCCQS